jgi:hypothetical protein
MIFALGLLAAGTLWLLYRWYPPLAPTPVVGLAESELRTEAVRLLSAPYAKACVYYWKGLVLLCAISDVPETEKRLLANGWVAAGEEMQFRRGRISASFECARSAGEGCALRMVYILRK